jgi:hypothetical protein
LKLKPLASHCKFLLGKVLLLFQCGGLGGAEPASHVAKGLAKAARLRRGQKTLRHGQHGGVEESVLAVVQRIGELGQRLLIAAIGLKRLWIFAGQITCCRGFSFGHLILPRRQ